MFQPLGIYCKTRLKAMGGLEASCCTAQQDDGLVRYLSDFSVPHPQGFQMSLIKESTSKQD